MKSIVISPHSDDAALSCYHALTARSTVIVPFSRSRWGFGRNGCDVSDTRMREDTSALLDSCLVDELAHLGFADSSLRMVRTFVTAVEEKDLVNNLSAALKGFLRSPIDNVYIPFGCGMHVDHLICRLAAEVVFEGHSLRYYCEQPYLQKNETVLEECAWAKVAVSDSGKRKVLNHYRSQLTRDDIDKVLMFPEYYCVEG